MIHLEKTEKEEWIQLLVDPKKVEINIDNLSFKYEGEEYHTFLNALIYINNHKINYWKSIIVPVKAL